MINRIFLKEFLSFNEVELELEKGLVVFTGPSGAGKSVLMQSILSLFGIGECKASLGEASLSDIGVEDEVFDIQKDDEIIIKEIKKDKVRYFLNAQTISKKNLNDFSKKIIRHLHLKDTTDFDSSKLIEFLDFYCTKYEEEFTNIKNEFDEKYLKLSEIKKS